MEGSCKAEFLARKIVTRGPRFRVGVQLCGPEAVFEAIYECALGASIAFEPKNYATIMWKKLMAGAAVPFKQSSGA